MGGLRKGIHSRRGTVALRSHPTRGSSIKTDKTVEEKKNQIEHKQTPNDHRKVVSEKKTVTDNKSSIESTNPEKKEPMYKYEIIPIADKYTEILPSSAPLKYSFFRYLGFKIKSLSTGKTIKGGNRAIIVMKIVTESMKEHIVKVNRPFEDGVYYFEDIDLSEIGKNKFYLSVESNAFDCVKPYTQEVEVFEYMELADNPELQNGAYAVLRQMIHKCIMDSGEEALSDESFIEKCVTHKSNKLRKTDTKWYLRVFQQRLDIANERLMELSTKFINKPRRSHNRKQIAPIRTGTKREHENYFNGKAREVKRKQTGKIRIIFQEPIAANETITVFNTRELYGQLAAYATFRM